MTDLRNTESVKQQYSNSENLNTRKSIHEKYSINKQGFGNWINEQYHLYNGCHILELGCGNGDMWLDNVKSIGKDSTLILSDFSAGMVDEVKEKYSQYENVSFEQINIENIPYQDNTFDFVIANMMLYHVPVLDQALSEVARVLKMGGTFYSATIGENGIHQYLMTVMNDYGISKDINQSFTLQNGNSILSKYFNNVVKTEYIDALEITDTNDLINYIFSMTSFFNVKEDDRKSLYDIFEKRKDAQGVIRIPKEYGMFLSTNN